MMETVDIPGQGSFFIQSLERIINSLSGFDHPLFYAKMPLMING
jgi:hypothetical protein